MALDELPPPGFYDDEPTCAANDIDVGANLAPHDFDAEAAVVSAVLLAYTPAGSDRDALEKVRRIVRPEHFHAERHRRIYEACVELADAGMTHDVVTVAGWLRDHERLAQVGGMSYLTEVLSAAPAVTNVGVYAERVLEKARARQALAISARIGAEVRAGASVSSVVGAAAAQLTTLQPLAPEESNILYGAELAEPLAPISWLSVGLKLTAGAPTFIAGNAFSGKSLACEDLKIALAMGGDAYGAFRCRRGRGLTLDFDGQGQRVSQERAQRLVRARGGDLRDLGRAIAYKRRPGFYLDDADAIDRLLRLLDGFDLCIIDSWRGATPATDEWRRGPVQIVGDRLEAVSTKTGCVIVVIDHNVKPSREGNSNRSSMHDVHGSTAKTEMAQSHFSFTGAEGEPLTRVKHVKERVTGQTMAPFALRFEDVEREGDPRWGLAVRHVDREQMKERPNNAGDDDLSQRRIRRTWPGRRRRRDGPRTRLLPRRRLLPPTNRLVLGWTRHLARGVFRHAGCPIGAPGRDPRDIHGVGVAERVTSTNPEPRRSEDQVPGRLSARIRIGTDDRPSFTLAVRGDAAAEERATLLWMPKVPKSANKAKTSLYPSEDAKLLGCRDVLLERRLAYGILAREGMRASELGTLRWRDVDLKHGRVRLDANKTDDPRAWALSPDVARTLAWWQKRTKGQEGDLALGLDLHEGSRWLRGRDGDETRPGDLRIAGVTRPELFERGASRQPIRLHDLRATFVTVSLANGKTEQWVTDRTGHKSSQMIALYARQARTWAELELGQLGPLDELLPEVKASARKRGRNTAPKPSKPPPDDWATIGPQVAPPAGVEPAANALGKRCSIH